MLGFWKISRILRKLKCNNVHRFPITVHRQSGIKRLMKIEQRTTSNEQRATKIEQRSWNVNLKYGN